MQFLTCIIALAILSFGTVAAAPADSSSSSLRPTIFGEINGTAFSMQGTVSEVHAAIEAQYPGYLDSQAELKRAENSYVERNKGAILCDVPVHLSAGKSGLISSAAAELKNSPFQFEIYPRLCILISCQLDDARKSIGGIYLCNDNNYNIHPSLNYLGTYADDIVGKCARKGYTKGQEFDSDNYNVVVTGGCDPSI